MSAPIPRVSVLIPFLNAGAFLRQAVESVVQQTFHDWELLLLDDGSHDASTSEARGHAARNPERVRYFEHSNHGNCGISATLNLGLRHARGEYVAPLDADDVWTPTKLADQVALLDAQPRAAMLFGRSQYWSSWTGRPQDRFRDSVPPLGVIPDCLLEPPILLERILRREAPVPCPSSVLLRREEALRLGGFEDSFATNHSDQAFYSKLLLQAPALASRRVWARYRRHPSSAIARLKKSGEAPRARVRFLEWLEDYLSKARPGEARLRTAVEEELVRARRRAAAGANAVGLVGLARRLGRRVLTPRSRNWLRRQLRGDRFRPGVGHVRFGDLRRLQPLGRRWGAERGTPVDRLYIEDFLERNAGDIRGRVLEIGDDTYTWRFGGLAVLDNDVLDVREGNPGATIVADLANAGHISSDRFDCIVFTQTLHLLYDVKATVRTLHRILKPSGVLLATVPGISPIGRPADWGESWHWSFTALSARRLFRETFPETGVTVESKGNLLAAAAFLYGLAAEELAPRERDHNDPSYPVSILVRAVKADEGSL